MDLPRHDDGIELDNTTLTPDGRLGWWMVLGSRPNAIPAMDLRCHILGPSCWCRPVDNDEMLTHNALDQREAHEQGDRRVQ